MTDKILENFQFGEIKSYILYLESFLPYDSGVFFSFDSEFELIEVVRNELLEFSGTTEEEFGCRQIELEKIMPNSIHEFNDDIIEKINALTWQWKIGYIGTLLDLMNSGGWRESQIRGWFRDYKGMLRRDESAIKNEEIIDFKSWMIYDN
jgi:hypothetical protein